MAQIWHNYTKVKIETMQQPENSGEVEKGSMEAIRKQSSSQKIDFLNFHKEKKFLYLYLLHSLLQVGIQTVLLSMPAHIQTPAHNETKQNSLQHQQLLYLNSLPDQELPREENEHLWPHHLVYHKHLPQVRLLHLQHPSLPTRSSFSFQDSNLLMFLRDSTLPKVLSPPHKELYVFLNFVVSGRASSF